MENLKKALVLRRKYNRMDFDEFAELVKNYVFDELPEDEKERFEQEKKQFEFTGLNNVDFFTIWVEL